MARLLPAVSTVLASIPVAALAQAAEAPAEKASPLVVVAFLAVFIGICVGYFVYLGWTSKRKGSKED